MEGIVISSDHAQWIVIELFAVTSAFSESHFSQSYTRMNAQNGCFLCLHFGEHFERCVFPLFCIVYVRKESKEAKTGKRGQAFNQNVDVYLFVYLDVSLMC